MRYVALGDSISIDYYTGVKGRGAASQFAREIGATEFQNLTKKGVAAPRDRPRAEWDMRRALGIASLLVSLLVSMPAGADPAEDAFAAGYATALVERELAIAVSVVTVKDGVVTVEVKSLAGVDRDRIVRVLSRIRGVRRVEVVQAPRAPGGVAAPGTPPGPTTTPTPTGPAVQAQVPPRGLQVLPAGHLFQPLIADPRWPHFAIAYHRFVEDPQLRDVAAVSLGETIPLLRDDLAFGGQWDLGIQAAVFSIFDLDRRSVDLVNADYMAGLPIGFRLGDFSAQLRVFHQSSHLGDEFLLRNRVNRINLSYEAVDLHASYEIGGWLRAYAGGGYIFRRDPSDLKPWFTQAGVELKSPRTFLAGAIRPIAAVDVQHREQNDWNSDISVRAGLQLEKFSILDRKLQLLLEYFNGHSPNGQFFRDRIEYIGLGLHLYLF